MDKLLNAIAVGLFFNLDANAFPFVSDIKVDLFNELEIITARQQIPFRGTINFSFNIRFREAQFGNTFVSITNIANSPYKDLLDHYLRLFRQGLTHADSFDKFFTLWRAFNAMYNFHSLKKSEPARVEETLHLLLNQGDQNQLVASFQTFHMTQ